MSMKFTRAINEMQKGAKITRVGFKHKQWPYTKYLHIDDGRVIRLLVNGVERDARITSEDMLAKDWSIYNDN